MKIKNIISNILLVGSCLTFFSCDDFLTTSPTSSLTDPIVVTDVAGLQAQLNGTYRVVRDGAGYGANLYSPEGIKALSSVTGLDIMVNDEQTGDLFYFSAFNMQRYEATQSVPRFMWYALYKMIDNANVVIANIDNAVGDQRTKDEIKGQALALRARCYYNLIRFYQHTYAIAKDKPGVPVYLEPTITPQGRETVETVYKRIVTDLTDAETLLKDFDRAGNKNIYNIDVVRFLLADVYLTMNDWENAQKYANHIRTKYSLMSMDQYADGFSIANSEWVLGYTQGSQDYWWYDSPACWFDFGQNKAPWQAEILMPVNHFVEVVMKDDPRNLTIANPLKRGYYAASKFRELRAAGPYGDLYDLRAAEMFLVEAEATCRLGKTQDALSILNTLQKQRGAKVTTTTNKDDLLSDILLERRKEMWGEGLDYFDVMRLQVGVKKSVSEGFFFTAEVPANSNKLIMQIPERELVNNPDMVQNQHPDKYPVFVP